MRGATAEQIEEIVASLSDSLRKLVGQPMDFYWERGTRDVTAPGDAHRTFEPTTGMILLVVVDGANGCEHKAEAAAILGRGRT